MFPDRQNLPGTLHHPRVALTITRILSFGESMSLMVLRERPCLSCRATSLHVGHANDEAFTQSTGSAAHCVQGHRGILRVEQAI